MALTPPGRTGHCADGRANTAATYADLTIGGSDSIVGSPIIKTAIVTTVTQSYVPLARVLMASAAKHHPEAARCVVVLDGGDVTAARLTGGTSEILARS